MRLQRHLNPLIKSRKVARSAGRQGPFEIVGDGQQLEDERVLLRGRAGFGFLPAASLVVFKVCGQAQMQIPLLGEILEECF